MTGPLAAFGKAWAEFINELADHQVALLRRTSSDMADALDHAAQRDVEGSREWRDLQNTRNRYAD